MSKTNDSEKCELGPSATMREKETTEKMPVFLTRAAIAAAPVHVVTLRRLDGVVIRYEIPDAVVRRVSDSQPGAGDD